jgi:hypothetical protein
MYKRTKEHFKHLVYAKFNKDLKYAIGSALSFILREILAHFSTYTPPKNDLE